MKEKNYPVVPSIRLDKLKKFGSHHSLRILNPKKKTPRKSPKMPPDKTNSAPTGNTNSATPGMFWTGHSVLRNRTRAHSSPRKTSDLKAKRETTIEIASLISQYEKLVSAGDDPSFTPDQLEMMRWFFNRYSLKESDDLAEDMQTFCLTPFLYTQILDHFRLALQEKGKALEEEFTQKNEACLKKMRSIRIHTIPAMPDDIDKIKDKNRQLQRNLIWQLSYRPLLADDYRLALLSRLPDNNPELANPGIVYMADNSDYVVLDPKGDLQQDTLSYTRVNLNRSTDTVDTHTFKLDQLADKIHQPEFIEDILNRLANKGHARPVNPLAIHRNEFKYAVQGLIHLTDPNTLLQDINALLPRMGARQTAMMQILLLNLINQKGEQFSSKTREYLFQCFELIEKHKNRLQKKGFYFLPAIRNYESKINHHSHSKLYRNTNRLQHLFEQNLKNKELMSFFDLFDAGVEAFNENKKEVKRQEIEAICQELANEMRLASCYFYKTLSISEFYYPDKPGQSFNKFLYFTGYLIDQLYDQLINMENDETFASTIKLLLNICNYLFDQTGNNRAAGDLNSLFIICSVLEKIEVTEKFRENPLTKKLEPRIHEVSEPILPLRCFKNARNLNTPLGRHLPILAMIDQDFKQLAKKDAAQITKKPPNKPPKKPPKKLPKKLPKKPPKKLPKKLPSDRLVELAHQSKYFQPIFQVQPRLSAQTILFSTTIFKHIPEKMTWPDDVDFFKNLERLEQIIHSQRIPIILNNDNTYSGAEQVTEFVKRKLYSNSGIPYRGSAKTSQMMLQKTEARITTIDQKLRQIHATLEPEREPVDVFDKREKLIKVSGYGQFYGTGKFSPRKSVIELFKTHELSNCCK